MNMSDFIIIIIVALILILAIRYIYKSKKSGKHCIGCPENKNCSNHCCKSHSSK